MLEVAHPPSGSSKAPSFKDVYKRQPVMLQDPWLIEKLAHFDREVIPERRMHAKGSGAYGTFTVIKIIRMNDAHNFCSDIVVFIIILFYF